MNIDDDNDETDRLNDRPDIEKAHIDYITESIGDEIVHVSSSGDWLGPFVENDEADALGINDLRDSYSDEELLVHASSVTQASFTLLRENGANEVIYGGEIRPLYPDEEAA